MTTVDLITGFLGAGKTTFIRKYADFLESEGEKVHIIENDFGNLCVDANLLSAENRDVSALTGGCLCCTGRKIFQDMLIEISEKGYTRILVEPSGIFDVNMFLNTLTTPPVNTVCQIGNIITVADSQPDQVLEPEAQSLIASQLIYSGALILSKTQFHEPQEVQASLDHLQTILDIHGCSRNLNDLFCLAKPWDQLEEEDFRKLTRCGFRTDVKYHQDMNHMSVFTMTMIVGKFDTREHLDAILHELLNTNKYGKIYRIKGFIKDACGEMYSISGTSGHWELQKVPIKRGLFCVIGQDYDEKAVKDLFLSMR